MKQNVFKRQNSFSKMDRVSKSIRLSLRGLLFLSVNSNKGTTVVESAQVASIPDHVVPPCKILNKII